jgi:hypothetical protein
VLTSSSRAYPSFTSTFPIPDEQPSGSAGDWPFLGPRPSYAEEDLLGSPKDMPQWRGLRRRRCLLTDDGLQRNFAFEDDGLVLSDDWRTINALLPVTEFAGHHRRPGGLPQSELDGVFHRIRHELVIQIAIQDSSAGNVNKIIRLTAPIRFGTSPVTILGPKSGEELLPAYIQVYHENGDLRQCDPLPLYSEAALAASTNPGTPASPVPTYKSLFPESLAAAPLVTLAQARRGGPEVFLTSGSCPNGATELDAGSVSRTLKTVSRRTAHNLLTRMFA